MAIYIQYIGGMYALLSYMLWVTVYSVCKICVPLSVCMCGFEHDMIHKYGLELLKLKVAFCEVFVMSEVLFLQL